MNEEDRQWFKKLLTDRLEGEFQLKFDEVVPHEPLFYGDFMIPNADVNVYCQITDEKKVGYFCG